MTEIAAVSAHMTAKTSAGAAKGAKGVGAASALDGAFAALFSTVAGKGDGTETTDASSLAVLAGKAAAPKGDAALPEVVAGQVATQVSAESTDDKIDPTTGKARKHGAKAKAKIGKEAAPDIVLAVAVTVTDKAPAQPQGNESETSAAPQAIEAAGPRRTAAWTTRLAAKNAEATDGKAMPAADRKAGPRVEVPSPKLPDDKAAPVAREAVAAPKAQAPQGTGPNANVSATPDLAQADRSGAQSNGQDTRKEGSPDHRSAAMQPASASAANDDSAVTAPADPLRDIVQSLPPVVQSQLAVAPASGSAAPVAATGELLGDKVIDMGVSGQWIDRMAREIATLADGTGHSRFELSPPNLGKIQVDLWHGDDKMNLRIVAETDEAAQRLRDGQDALATHARIASLSLGSVSVEKSAVPLDSARDQNQRQNADQSGNPQQQASNQAQGQSGQGRGGSGANTNREGFSAMMGPERNESEPVERATRASDPRVRFA